MSAGANIKSALDATRKLQAEAAEPAASVWVSANAGTGKTHVLTQRVLRLMLTGTPPERILCLTYTKAAAAEMSSRVFQTLAAWVTLPDAELEKVLFELDGRVPDTEAQRRARTLFAKAIETPGGLKMQTIHAFAERLLQRFPLEARVPPGFSILDDGTAKELKSEAIASVLKTATDQPGSLLNVALRTAVAYAADDRFDDVLSAAIEERDAIAAAVRMDDGASEPELTAFARHVRQHFNVSTHATEEGLMKKLAAVVHDIDLRQLRDALASSSAADQTRAGHITLALSAEIPAQRVMALKRYFMTLKGKPAATLMTAPVRTQYPELDEIAGRAQRTFIALWSQVQSLKAVTATIALTRLAADALQTYTDAKARRAGLDFDDLIERTRYLLSTESGRTAWVLYKLDGGLDHILVDEAQDTSPAQWRIVEALASEFFAGEAARDVTRTLFAVGDEKQSIYSFQGAMPEMFARTGAAFQEMAGHAGERWRQIGLTLSFRTVEPILAAVDQVFTDPLRTPGLNHTTDAIRHSAQRQGHAGSIEVWPPELPEETADVRAFEPLDEPARSSPVLRLANKIASTIDGWLKTGERLASENRAIRAGDILILVHRRAPFATPMVAALKARGISVAGADRMRLTEQIAVKDLMALGRFLTLPEDDLSLAEVLKGPLVGFNDDTLMQIAVGRKGTLWKALLDWAETGKVGAIRDAVTQLKRWRARADFAPPYEFYASLLEKDRGREKMLARLGPEAADPIDEFLNLALTYDDGAPPSLTGFLTMLSETEREVKRDMDQGADEVRVMTVHGAKGLEAPIVFLPDTCRVPGYRSTTNPLIQLPEMQRPGDPAPPVFWHIKGAGDLAPVEAAKKALNTRQVEEYNRLLYVAMTRARDRLYVAGFQNGKSAKLPKDCWYELIRTALGTEGAGDGVVSRRDCAQTAQPEAPKVTMAEVQAAVALPEFAKRSAPREITSSVPLAPSRLEPYAHDETGEPGTPKRPERTRDEPAVVSPGVANEDARFLRGSLTHALLQHLPGLNPTDWERAAAGYVAARAGDLSQHAAQSIVTETLAILGDPRFTDVFRAPSRAEVAVAAVIQRKSGKGPPLKLSGQIDRLVVGRDHVLIVDFKTNRVAPLHPERVADAYLFQLAAYRLALEEIYPGKRLRAALLWTAGPTLMEIPSALLDAAEKRLFALDFARLDA